MAELTNAQKHLIHWLKIIGMSEDETVGIMVAMKTPRQRDLLMSWMADHREATKSDIIGRVMYILKVKDFADKWLKIFTDVPPDADRLFEGELGADCEKLEFVMDNGDSFLLAYYKGDELDTRDGLAGVIDEVDNVGLLGSAIYSNWRKITHWSYDSGFSEENKAWFLMALTRLNELVF